MEANVKAIISSRGHSPLHGDCEKGHMRCVQELLGHNGVNANSIRVRKGRHTLIWHVKRDMDLSSRCFRNTRECAPKSSTGDTTKEFSNIDNEFSHC